MTRIERINYHLKEYDRELYAQRECQGHINVYRKGTTYERFDFRGGTLLYPRPSPHYVLSLTHNWGVKGKPVEWGIEPLIDRLRSIDGWREELESVADQIQISDEKEARDFKNHTESYLIDNYRMFKKAFSDINVAGMDMKKDKRRKEDGYC